ncbi:spore germination protein GerW family protein [Paractinoplanes lichenicola]|uniref:Sporulation protein n=1 Tax=Paractinoplanes lichenicola TaxID=2802976 RepID=A0ABS1VS23_9ACTN|nr:spore germination protein GerW family protein [Actinoplanes lichenicola]MBL7257433.1 sporulation protein [Actinoplanes lichenicola]
MAETTTDVQQALNKIVESAAADRVFGEPIHHDGVVVLPVAKISGGAGGGGGTGPAPEGQEAAGNGGGLGIVAKPLGVFVLSGGTVTWRPAVDVNRIVLGGQLVVVAALLVARTILKAHLRKRASGDR